MKKLKEKIPHWNLRVILGKKTTNGLPDLPGVSAKELPEQPTKIKRKRMSRKKKIVLAVLIAVIIIAGFWFWMSYNRRRAMEAIRESASQVETVQVTRQNLIDSISVTGTIASADARDVSASASNVEVLEVNYDVGDYVNAGDVIVVLDSSSLEDSLEQAQNSQALSEYTENKSIETATENYNEAVEDGTDTYNTAVENEADAKEALQDAEAELSDAAERLERREERLNEANSALDAAVEPTEPTEPTDGVWTDEEKANSEEYQNYLTELEAYNALVTAAQEAQTSYTEAHQAYETAAAAEEQALETYETASENLETAQTNNDRNIDDAADQLEQAQVQHEYSNDSSQQTIENYQEQIESCTVTAPISGVITAMNVEVGDTYMGENSALFSVADNENFVVSANVDEYDISSISEGMEAAVIVEALGEDELPATVSFVSPTVTTSSMGSSTYAIEIALDDVNTDLRIGMTAQASIVLEAAYDVLTVPYDCVETDEDGNSVVYVDQDGERTAVSVEVCMQGDYYVEVSGDGLDENTMVYYNTPLVNSEATDSGDDSGAAVTFTGGGGGGMPGGGGGMPGGGGPGGGF